MLPCRVFLQKVEVYPNISQQAYKPQLSLTLNSIYYDSIKPFQTKYFCLSARDIIGIEAVVKGTNADVDQSGSSSVGKGSGDGIGRVEIENVYKLAVEGKVVEIKINSVGGGVQ